MEKAVLTHDAETTRQVDHAGGYFRGCAWGLGTDRGAT